MSEKFRFSKELQRDKNGEPRCDKRGNAQYGMTRNGDHVGVNADGNDVFRDVDYWSEESLRPKSLEELYPPPKEEDTGEYYELAYDDYREQLAKIAMTLAERDGKQPVGSVDEAIAELNAARKKEDEALVKNGFKEPVTYDGASTPFGDAIYKSAITEEQFRFRMPNQLLTSDVGRYGLDKSNQIDQKAEWYNQNLKHLRERLVESRVSNNDRELVAKRDKGFKASRTELEERAEFYDKTLESLMYAMASRGVLGDAEPIWTSEYDDIDNGVDGAFVIACDRTDAVTKKSSRVKLPIAIDCTAGSSKRTIYRKLGQSEDDRRHSFEYNGVAMPDIQTRLKYAANSDGSDADDHWAYRFVVGLDRDTMINEVLSEDKIDQSMSNIKKIINAQLQSQAYVKAVYCGLMAYRSTSVEERTNWQERFFDVMALRDAFNHNIDEAIADGASSGGVIGSKHDAQQLIVDKTNEIRIRLSEMIPRQSTA